jgi:ActR/RegA family two-component response regulator
MYNNTILNSLKYKEKLEQFVTMFSRQVNVLVIDDDAQIGLMLQKDVFCSSLFNLKHVKSIREAVRELSDAKIKWHCWIVDINLKEKDDGSTLLDLYPQFDYAIVFSGVSTLETATRVLQKGAIAAFSKDPAFLYNSDAFYNEVCKVSALSFILNGAPNKHLSVFRPLLSNVLTTVDDWALAANISQRQLQRVCELYVPFAPRMLLPFYHTLYFLLRESVFTENFDSPTTEDTRISNANDYYITCFNSVLCKDDEIYINYYMAK